ncbi:MAG: hypothetical protein M3179_11350 [Actinomycetota bacterium]|nr:hypothetical protein [Actinomycetota bacterium]
MNSLLERLTGFRDGRTGLDDDEHQARRSATLFAVALIVVALGGLIFVLLRSDGSDSDQPVGQLSSVDIGPAPGTDLNTYMSERQKALDNASGKRVAVVSFDQYVTEPDAKAAADSVSVAKLLAAAPGGSPSVVSGSIGSWAEDQVRVSREDRDELQKMLPTVDDPAFRDYYQAEINNLTVLVDRVKPDGPLVFGLVVRGDAEDLKKLASRPNVRLVDVGQSGKTSPDALYRGLRPEETAKADEPPTRPV